MNVSHSLFVWNCKKEEVSQGEEKQSSQFFGSISSFGRQTIYIQKPYVHDLHQDVDDA